MGILDILRLTLSRYSYFLHTVPISIYAFYYHFKDLRHPLIDALIKTGLLAIGIGAITSFIACVMGIPLKSIISFEWYYYGPLHWGIFFLSYYYILHNRKEESKLASFTLATLATAGGGWLYEVPYWHPISMFLVKYSSLFYNNIQILCVLLLLFELRKKRIYNPNPLIYAILLSSMFLGWKGLPYPNSQIICLLLLGYELFRRGFKPNRFIIIMFLIFIAFSIPLFMNKTALLDFCMEIFSSLNINWTYSYTQKVKWIYRIPASLFLLSLLNGINKQGDHEMSLLKRFKERRRRDRLYLPPPEQGFMKFLKRQLIQRGVIPTTKRIYPTDRLGIVLNRYCNLKCYSCTALGRNPPRDETTLEEIQAYVKNIEGYYPESVFMLTGGEPTAIDHEKLEKICDLIHEKGHETAILTNGFRLIPVEWIDYVLLDRHGINDDDIVKWIEHLKKNNHEKYEVLDTLWHMDIAYSLEDNITMGARCSSWINTITLWKDVVYPCCNHMHMAVWDSVKLDQKLTSDLRDSGWNAYNPDLVETIRNWRETLPGEAFRVCSVKCFKHSSKTRWEKIA